MDHLSIRVAVAAMALLAGIGAAVAQSEEAERRGPPTFESLDIDGNGEITASDLEAMRAQRFDEVDVNGDGQISEAEFTASAEARAAERAARMFDRLDADGDGMLSRDALESRFGSRRGERMLSRADTDGSGGVSAEEYATALQRLAEHRLGTHGDRGPKSR